MSNESTGKQGGAPSLPNNFSAKKPDDAGSHAPKIGGAQSGGNATGPALTENRGKQAQG